MSASTGAGRDVVCFAGQDWWYHNQAHSDFQLVRRIAERRTVLVVNSIGLRMPLPGRSTQFLRRLGRKLRSLTRLARRPDPHRPRFVVYSPWILPFYSSARLRGLNARLLRLQLRVLVRRLGLNDPAYVLTLPTAAEVVRGLDPRAVVYNRSDKLSAFPEVDRAAIEAMEARLLREADAVLYVSHLLMAEDAAVVGERAVFLDHGVDLELFTRTRPAAELAAVPGPRIGWFGALDDYTVDFDLLERLAVEIPQASLVLVGSATRSMQALTRHPNVRWLGHRPYEQIPALGSAFDVAIMPWLRNEWVGYSNPIKLKEYLALGLPVVTMPFPEADRYAEVLDIACDPDDFVAAVRRRLDAPGSDQDAGRRRARVLTDSWDRRAQELLEICESVGRPSCAASPG